MRLIKEEIINSKTVRKMKEKIFKKDKGNIGVTEMIMLLLTIIICFTIYSSSDI